MKLTAAKVKSAKPGRYADGNGLYLLVSPGGSKSWVLRVQVQGKRHDYGLGSTTLLTLAEAREKAAEWKKVARAGRNPSKELKSLPSALPTFRDAAEQYHASRKSSWKNAKHAQQWINTLETYVYPVLGGLPVEEINAAHIQAVLVPIWQSKPETARRVRQRIGTVLDYCYAMGWREADAPMRAVNTLLKGIKQPPKRKFAAMPYQDVPGFMTALSERQQTAGRLALQFAILTAVRSGEVRGARWSEIKADDDVWVIPAERMKMGVEHVVPLSPPAIALLEEAADRFPAKPHALIFPGQGRKSLSDMTLSKALKDNGGGDYTVHGFRSSFRDWAAEQGFANDWAEAALAHAVPNRTEAAYKRTTFLEQRRGLMQAWARFATAAAK